MVLFVLILLMPGVGAAVQVRVTPASVTAESGSLVSVAVEADTVEALGGFQFRFTYVPTELQVVSLVVNPAFDQVITQDTGGGSGSGTVAAVVYDQLPLSGAPVNLATLTFRVLTSNSGAVVLDNVVLGKIGGAEISSTSVPGVITVAHFPVVTFTSSGNGTVSGVSPQTLSPGGSTSSVKAIPSVGYHFVSWTGPGNVTSADNPLTVTNVTTDQTISANFVGDSLVGRCGASNGALFAAIPTLGLCSVGVPSTVSGSGPWMWSCGGINGGGGATCQAGIDRDGPKLVVSTLADGGVTNNSILNVSGTVSDASAVSGVTVNGVHVDASTGSFSYAVRLQTGANQLNVAATDALGNVSVNSRTILLDTTVPTLAVSEPADNGKTARSELTVSGTIDKQTTVIITVMGGTPQGVSLSGGSFSTVINLAVGLNSIKIIAIDGAGKSSTVVRTVTYDNSAPSLTITSPPQDISSTAASIAVTGTVSDTQTTATVTMTFNGVTYTLPVTDGVFSQLLPVPPPGTYPVVTTAIDEAGNRASVTRNIVSLRDVTQPAVESFTVPEISTTLKVSDIVVTPVDAARVAGYFLSETSTAPRSDDPGWQELPPTWFNFSVWGNHMLYASVKDSAGTVSPSVGRPVFVGTQPGADGVLVTSAGKIVPNIADALRSLRLATGAEVSTDPEYDQLHGIVAPLVNGIPTPNGRKQFSLGDTIVILRRVVGLW